MAKQTNTEAHGVRLKPLQEGQKTKTPSDQIIGMNQRCHGNVLGLWWSDSTKGKIRLHVRVETYSVSLMKTCSRRNSSRNHQTPSPSLRKLQCTHHSTPPSLNIRGKKANTFLTQSGLGRVHTNASCSKTSLVLTQTVI